ncbi:MAG: D-2-hydroxyacid dehydrogenase [Comamonas sp.]|nr:D-2-hydroxyacid dehydrogenase [Comamonas sp.]
MHDQPLKVLVSVSTAQNIGASITAQAAPLKVQLLTPENARPGDAVDIAFVSRDVTGLSTKHQTLPDTQHFYNLMTQAPKLHWLHVHSAGADRQIYLDLQAHGVQVTTSAGNNAEVVAQTAVAGLLAIGRRFPELWRAQQQRMWSPLIRRALPPDLHGQTVTIVGWGGIGKSIARILQAIGLQIQVVRSSSTPTEEGFPCCAYEDIDTVLANTQWLVLACPLTPRTRYLIHGERMALLPAGAGIVNVARGDVLDEAALIALLQSEHLGGAYLDVFAHEPLSENSLLWSLPNVIATPHSAGFSAGNAQRVTQMFLDNLHAFAHEKPLRNIVTSHVQK